MRRPITVLVLLSLAGCATPYGQRGLMGGYTDTRLGRDRFLITFSGNGFTSEADVEQGAYRRATEVCAQNGYATFRVLRGNANEDTQLIAGGNRQNWHVNTVTRHSITMHIQCINEETPPPPASSTAVVAPSNEPGY